MSHCSNAAYTQLEHQPTFSISQHTLVDCRSQNRLTLLHQSLFGTHKLKKLMPPMEKKVATCARSITQLLRNRADLTLIPKIA